MALGLGVAGLALCVGNVVAVAGDFVGLARWSGFGGVWVSLVWRSGLGWWGWLWVWRSLARLRRDRANFSLCVLAGVEGQNFENDSKTVEVKRLVNVLFFLAPPGAR